MATLKRDDILTADDIARELVPVPEWGGEVWVKGMSGTERDNFEAGIIERRGKDTNVNMKNIRAKLAAACLCDENGKRLFADADIPALAAKSAAALQRVFAVAQRLSGIGDDEVKELAEGVKNDPFDGSPTN